MSMVLFAFIAGIAIGYGLCATDTLLSVKAWKKRMGTPKRASPDLTIVSEAINRTRVFLKDHAHAEPPMNDHDIWAIFAAKFDEVCLERSGFNAAH